MMKSSSRVCSSPSESSYRVLIRVSHVSQDLYDKILTGYHWVRGIFFYLLRSYFSLGEWR